MQLTLRKNSCQCDYSLSNYVVRVQTNFTVSSILEHGNSTFDAIRSCLISPNEALKLFYLVQSWEVYLICAEKPETRETVLDNSPTLAVEKYTS